VVRVAALFALPRAGAAVAGRRFMGKEGRGVRLTLPGICLRRGILPGGQAIRRVFGRPRRAPARAGFGFMQRKWPGSGHSRGCPGEVYSGIWENVDLPLNISRREHHPFRGFRIDAHAVCVSPVSRMRIVYFFLAVSFLTFTLPRFIRIAP